jgi:hypothetical protein
MEEMQLVTLDTLAGGGAAELWEAEFRKLMDNVQDINTDPEAKRSVTLEVLVQPSKDREGAKVTVKVSSKLASFQPLSTNVFIGRRDGQLVAVSFDPRQTDAFRTDDSVHPLSRNREVVK